MKEKYFFQDSEKNKQKNKLEKIDIFFKKILKEVFNDKNKKNEKEDFFKPEFNNLDKKVKNQLEKSVYIFEEPITNFLFDIKDKFLNNYYDFLIGDDVKGRIPTLILREVFNYQRQKNNLNNIEVKFLSGGKKYNWTSKKFNNIIEILKKLDLKNKKILLITEYMLDEGFLKLANALKFLNLNFDCFACFSHYEKKFYLEKGREIFKKSQLYIGKEKQLFIDYLDNYSGIGVVKKDSYSALTKSLKTTDYVFFTRIKIKELAKKIIKKLFEE